MSIYINTDVVPDDPTTEQSTVVGTDDTGKKVFVPKKEKLDRTKFGNFIAPLGMAFILCFIKRISIYSFLSN